MKGLFNGQLSFTVGLGAWQGTSLTFCFLICKMGIMLRCFPMAVVEAKADDRGSSPGLPVQTGISHGA